jgi:hypothetical protein
VTRDVSTIKQIFCQGPYVMVFKDSTSLTCSPSLLENNMAEVIWGLNLTLDSNLLNIKTVNNIQCTQYMVRSLLYIYKYVIILCILFDQCLQRNFGDYVGTFF